MKKKRTGKIFRIAQQLSAHYEFSVGPESFQGCVDRRRYNFTRTQK